MTKISKSFFMSMIYGSLGFVFFSSIAAGVIASGIRGSDEGGVILLLLLLLVSLIAIAVSFVFQFILLHRLWTVIQGEDARTTPGKAVGFCFIPFFSFYWIFQAYYGWAVDCNRHASRIGLKTCPANEGVALWVCILSLCCIIPILNYLVGVGALVLLIIFYNNAINSANTLIEFRGMSIHDGESA